MHIYIHTYIIHQHLNTSNNEHNCSESHRHTKKQFTLDSTLTIFFGMDSRILGGSPNAIGTAFDAAQRAMMKLFFSSVPASTFSGLAPWPFAGLNDLSPIGTAGLALSFQRNPEHKSFRDAIAVLDREIYPLIRELRSVDSNQDGELFLFLFLFLFL
jgi:hypothetical protein